MVDSTSLLIALTAVLIWAVFRFLVLPKLIQESAVFNAWQKAFREKRRKLILRMGIVTALILIWAITLVATTGGIGHENNKYLFEATLLGIGLIWIAVIMVLRYI